LNPKTALIVIDLQKSIASIPSVHPMTDVVKNASKLTSAFRRYGLLVVLVNVTGGASGRIEQMQRGGAFPPDRAELLPELGRQPQDHLVTK
jgi:nicotinamidase-related amidase